MGFSLMDFEVKEGDGIDSGLLTFALRAARALAV
jgi:hypothetical protein